MHEGAMIQIKLYSFFSGCGLQGSPVPRSEPSAWDNAEQREESFAAQNNPTYRPCVP